DPNLEIDPFLGAQLLGVPLYLVLHSECCVERTLRMVLMRDRRAEQRENSVAGGLHDVSVEAMDRVHHQLERGVNDGASFLRIEVLDQIHRALDVSEQRRDHLSLAVGREHFWLLGCNADLGSRRYSG